MLVLFIVLSVLSLVAMVVGIVKSCRRDLNSAVFWHITVEPAADLNSLQQVAVICPLWTQE